MKQTLLFVLILSALTIASCTKKPTVSDYPSVTITSPAPGQSTTGGTVLHITGTATASGTDDLHLLHELLVTVTRPSTGAQVWMADISVHDEESHTIDTSFVLPVSSARDSLVLEAVVANHLGNSANQKVGFSVNP